MQQYRPTSFGGFQLNRLLINMGLTGLPVQLPILTSGSIMSDTRQQGYITKGGTWMAYAGDR